MEIFDISGPAPGGSILVDSILRALPDWFGLEQAIQDYLAEVPNLGTWTMRVGDQAVGFISVKQHFPEAAEVYVMGILPGYHRQGGSEHDSSARLRQA